MSEQIAEKPKRSRDPEGSITRQEKTVKTRRGEKVQEYFIVRVREVDHTGKLRQKKQTCYSKSEALEVRRVLRQQLHELIAAEKEARDHPAAPTFFKLLEYYEKNYVQPAKFVGDKKVSGQRDPVAKTRRMIAIYREFFGDAPLAEITYARLCEFKRMLETTQIVVRRAAKVNLTAAEISAARKLNPMLRATTKKVSSETLRDRKPATVHRILSRLRRILSVGVQQEMLAVNPFKKGDTLISIAIEETRTRICTFEEEEQLLNVCTEKRAHLKNIIICAIDTFMRQSELFNTLGSHVDFENRMIVVPKTNTKTLKERTVPLTSRALAALRELKAVSPDWNNSTIFGMKSAKKAWQTARRLTGIKNLRFHDLRGTGITRMLDAGIPEAIVMQFSGHEKYETFKKYVRKDVRIIQNAGDALDALYAKQRREADLEKVPNDGPNVIRLQQFVASRAKSG